MDTLFEDSLLSMTEFRFDHHPSSRSVYSNQNHVVQDFKADDESSPSSSSCSSSSTGSTSEGDTTDGHFSSAIILKFISEMLMEEEELEAKPCMLQDCLALQAAEKSFYDVLGQDYPSSSSSCPADSLQHTGSEGKRNSQNRGFGDDSEEDARKNKHSVIYPDDSEPSDIFDEVLLCYNPTQVEADSDCSPPKNDNNQNAKPPRRNQRTRQRKKRNDRNKEVVDLSTLLTQCAQAVASYDQTTTAQILAQIRQHSSPYGDDTQRLAHYFADGLEARFSGGTPPYGPLGSNGASAADVLKAYQVYLKACPFAYMSNFYANRTIGKLANHATTTIHIIDFGVLYGYQWPCLIQRLSERTDGPPKLRITGIEFPQPGFRPSERVEQTGRRLASYCKRFNVPFEYNVIAKKWENVNLEELQINRDGEVTVVNCLYRLKNLPDETVIEDNCPRDAVLNLIRRINPDLFIHGVVNGMHNAPFFFSRFREALFHFSALFDMFEASLASEDPHRQMFEREVFGRDVMNVVACEGLQRVERPETYKQWQVRNVRAGFEQVALDRDLLRKVKSMVKSDYHKDFVVDEDGMWMLQGWKGRILQAISCWRPV
ncbi:hypothetical protein TIFTF001_000433 [Ficus carica]|uniref:Scarecrow-like protein 30 n=1 Tax=Ficus carica TaxID=3494 RepID=A0AA88CJY0_FICCA|nr:hypothetical protein TIFTF001_000433 [Ficus carica]